MNKQKARNFRETRSKNGPSRPHRAPAGDAPQPVLVPNFADATSISNATVWTIFSNSLNRYIPSQEFDQRITVADNYYLGISPDFLRQAIITDPVLAAQNYHAEIFDCDDYVLYLKTKMSLYAAAQKLAAPLAVGFLLTEEHAFSICLDEQCSLCLINTQSDSIGYTNDVNSFSQFLSLKPNNRITTIYI